MRKGFGIAVAACAVSCLLAAPAQGYVYWGAAGAGTAADGTAISRADQDGSAIKHGTVNTASAPAGMAVDSAHIYWANTHTNSIGRANLDGSAANPTFIPNATTAPAGPWAVAVDGGHVYWTDGARYLGRANLDGSSPQPHYVDDGSNSFPRGIAVSQGTIYFSDLDIRDVPSGSTTPHTLAPLSGDAIPTSMAIAGGYIYYSALNSASPSPGGTIGRVAISGGTATNNFIPGLYLPLGVATDGQEIYWVDHGVDQNVIGRAQLSGGGVSNRQDNFISEPGGPFGVAVDANIDPTQTSVSCSPSSIAAGSATACTATVADSASTSPPTGTVSFSGNASTFFSGSGSSCTLAKQADGSYRCTVGVVPLNAGTTPVSASYGGDSLHQPSAGNTTLCAASGSPCGSGTGSGGGGSSGGSGAGGGTGGSSGSTGSQKCVIPKLKGKTLAQARRLLTRAHCKLGKVTRPKKLKKHHPVLVIASQQLRAGATRRVGAKVGLGLKLPPPRRHR